jgi:hypothetical protein
MRIVSLLSVASLLLVYIVAGAAASPPLRITSQNMIAISDASGKGVTNYPFQFGRPFLRATIPHAPQVLINGVPTASQADIKNRYPDGSVEFAIVAVVLPSIPANGSIVLTFQDTTTTSTPLTRAQMQVLLPVGQASMTLTPVSGTIVPGNGGKVDAGQMLADGNCKPWTAGPIAQTMECADDTARRKYDIGFGDGYHPFRPRFYVTFWHTIHAVSVRVIGENGLSTELEDIAYNLAVTVGSTVKTVDLTGTQATHPKKHWTAAAWSLGPYWIGTTPQIQVNINNELAYLTSTRFLPNFDPSITIPPAAIAADYADWNGKPNDPFDGSWNGGSGKFLNIALGMAGNHGWLGPYPSEIVNWLYTGDWRERVIALGVADRSGVYGSMVRESDPTRRFLRSDPVGAGTGLGRVLSRAGRPGMMFSVTNRQCSAKTPDSVRHPAGLAFCWGSTADNLPFIGASQDIGDPWEGTPPDHLPQNLFPQYILTGDPWYLNVMQMWTGTIMAANWPNGGNSPLQSGPDGTYPNIVDEWRGEGWFFRFAAETAFATPDGTPEKTYFTNSMNDLLANWEGHLKITGTVFDSTPLKKWSLPLGDPESSAVGHAIPPDHMVQDFYTPAQVRILEQKGWYVPGVVKGVGDPWMGSYVAYGLGRAVELGFAAKPLQAYVGKFFLDVIAIAPVLLDTYELPTEGVDGTLYSSISQIIAVALEPAYVTGVGFVDVPGAHSAPEDFQSGNVPGGRHTWLQPGIAMMVDQGLTSWNWWRDNVYSKVSRYGWSTNLGWNIVPRTDTNILPTQPTATPP